MRQSAVYQKFEYNQQINTWILVQPGKGVRNRVLEAYKARSLECLDGEATNPLEMHLIHLTEASANWRDYFNTLETHLLETTSNSVNTAAGSKVRDNVQKRLIHGDTTKDPCELLDVRFEMVQDLQKFEEIAQQFQTALEVNEEVVKTLRALNDKLHKFSQDPNEGEVSWQMFDNSLQQYLSQTLLQKRSVETLLKRIRGRAELVRGIKGFGRLIRLTI